VNGIDGHFFRIEVGDSEQDKLNEFVGKNDMGNDFKNEGGKAIKSELS
jgi:hypothetical protein